MTPRTPCSSRRYGEKDIESYKFIEKRKSSGLREYFPGPLLLFSINAPGFRYHLVLSDSFICLALFS